MKVLQSQGLRLPGGKVAVYTGILAVARNDAGLATVMAHEVAHAIAQHGSERMADQLAVQLGATGLQGQSEESRKLVMSAYGFGAQTGVLLPFGRKQESEADHSGLIYMARAGYDPREATAFWRRMAAIAGDDRPPELLSTHPDPERRAQDLEALMPEAVAEYEKAGR